MYTVRLCGDFFFINFVAYGLAAIQNWNKYVFKGTAEQIHIQREKTPRGFKKKKKKVVNILYILAGILTSWHYLVLACSLAYVLLHEVL